MPVFNFASWDLMNYIEAVTALLALMYTVYYIWTINRTSLIHRNLRFLLTSCALIDVVTLSWRMIELAAPSNIIGPEVHRVLKFSLLMSSSLSLFDLLYERYHAVYHYRTYYEQKKPFLLLAMLAAKILIVGICAGLRATIFHDSYLFTCILFSVLATSFLLAYLLFLKVAAALKKERENVYDLSCKYAMNECVKASKMLRVFIPFQAFANVLMVGSLTVILLYIQPMMPQSLPLAHSLLFLCFICTRILIGNSIAIYRHESLRGIARTDMRTIKIICLKKRVGPMAPEAGNQILSTIDGDTPVRIDRRELGNVQMNALDDIWNSDKAPKEAVQEVLNERKEAVLRAAKESKKKEKQKKGVRVREQLDPNDIEMDLRTNSTTVSQAASSLTIESIV